MEEFFHGGTGRAFVANVGPLRGFNNADVYAVDQDIIWREFHCPRFGQVHSGGAVHGGGEERGGGGVRVHGSDVDHARLVTLAQVGERGLDGALPGEDFDVEVGLERVVGDGFPGSGVRATCVVHQHINATKVRGSLGNKVFYLLSVGHVHNVTPRPTSKRLLGFLNFCGVAGAEGNACPGVDKRLNGGEAESFAAAGDHCGAAVES